MQLLKISLSLLATGALAHAMHISIDLDVPAPVPATSDPVDQLAAVTTENDSNPAYIFEIVKNCAQPTICNPCCACVIGPGGEIQIVCSGSKCSASQNARCAQSCTCKENKGKGKDKGLYVQV